MNDISNYPQNFFLTSGKGNSSFDLVSFDNALIDADISNYNLVRVSSILPMNCERKGKVTLLQGSPLLTAFAKISSNVEGEKLVTAIGVGIPERKDQIGIIMEYSGKNITEENARRITEVMVREAMNNHGIKAKEVLISSISDTVTTGWLSLVSAISLW